MSPHRCQFVPPYLIARLTDHADPHVAAAARATVQADRTFREGAPRPGPVRPTALPEAVGDGPQRTISDAGSSTTLPGEQVRGEGDAAVQDVAVNEAYDGLGATWQLYWTVYERDSLDGKGLPLDATVHYGQDYDNAFFDGSRMVFGDGDGQVFNRFTAAVDVIGHELTHGFTQYTSALVYRRQSGALNESVSDVFGSLVRQQQLGQTADQADWLIGKGLFTDQVQGEALRSMKAPGTAYDDDVLGQDPQPASMDDFVVTTDDEGGVHINSGIPNRAFHLAATGIGGNAWEGAGRVWYDVLTGPDIAPDCDFATFAQLTVAAATTRFGDGSAEVQAVESAWATVKVTSVPATPAADPATSRSPGVTVIRSGGFAGRRVERTIIPDELGDDAEAWRGLLRSERLRSLTQDSPVPDGYTYRVVAPDLGLDVSAPEHAWPDDVRRLVVRTLEI